MHRYYIPILKFVQFLTGETSDEKSVKLPCRTIRIGTHKFVPSEDVSKFYRHLHYLIHVCTFIYNTIMRLFGPFIVYNNYLQLYLNTDV